MERPALDSIFGNPKPNRPPLDDIFGVSAVPTEHRPASRFQSHLSPLSESVPTDDRGLGRKAFDAMTGGVQGFGDSIAGAITAEGDVRRVEAMQQEHQQIAEQFISEMKKASEEGNEQSLQNLSQSLEQHMERGQEIPGVAELNPAIEKTARQILGEAVETGAMALTGGLLTGGARALGGKVVGGLVKQSATTGAVIGGASAAQGEDAGIGDIAMGVGIGGAVGAGSAAAIQGAGAIVRRSTEALRARTAAGKELANLLADPASPLSQRLASITGDVPLDKIVAKDKTIKEAIRQGIDGPTAFVARHSNDATKAKLAKMVQISKKGFDNPSAQAQQQATDIVGESVIGRTKYAYNQLQQAGGELDVVAQGLRGNTVNLSQPQNKLSQDLTAAGIKIDGGKLNFSGSDFEGIAPAERAIRQIWERAQVVGDDAYAAHSMKRFIDNNVSYGKDVGGLTGQAERIVKGFRRSVDGVLDTTFPDYNAVNTKYAGLKDITGQIEQVLGKTIRTADDVASIKSGLVAERITKKSVNRGAILKLMNNLDELGRTTGKPFKDDLVSQVTFIDSLENIFGPRAAGTFRAQIGKAEKDLYRDIAGEMVGSAFTKEGRRSIIRRTFEGVRGISHEQRVKALEKLLEQS